MARITRADQAANPYFYVPFDVPEGTTRIDVILAYAKAEDCVIDLGAFDPRDTSYPTREGFRGWSGGRATAFSSPPTMRRPAMCMAPSSLGAGQ